MEEKKEKKNVLAKLGKNGILVTDIANQFWCEKQVELNYLYGKQYTKAMAEGTKQHEGLQAETYVPLEAEPLSYSDLFYKMGYENYMALKSLKKNGVGREIRIYGSINGYKLSGKIDELKIKNNKVTVVEIKTKISSRGVTEPISRPHKVQALIYKKMLDDIKGGLYNYNNFHSVYLAKLKPLSERFSNALEALGIPKDLMSIESIYTSVFNVIISLPDISNTVEIKYIDRYTGIESSTISFSYSKDEVNKTLIDAMGFWNGDRDARPVSKDEAWKCKICRFYGKECKVWL
ncbi:MAG: hypothetical protein ACP5RT_02610 [Candidatus Micrarchaeia archaeon]